MELFISVIKYFLSFAKAKKFYTVGQKTVMTIIYKHINIVVSKFYLGYLYKTEEAKFHSVYVKRTI